MPLTVAAYYNISDRAKELRAFYDERKADAAFIVPSGLDRDALSDLICGDEPFFGARPTVWTLGDLLGEFSHITGSRVRIIDPPDHHLILRHLLEKYIAEREAAGASVAPGLRHRGFVSLLGENIKDLLSEEVAPERLKSSLFGDEEPDASRPEGILLSLYERYVDYLREYDLADAAQIPTLAREELNNSLVLDFVKSKKFIFAGFLSFNGAQLKFVKVLAEAAELAMFQPETGLDDFYDGIRQLDSEYSQRPEWDVPVVRLEAGSDGLEAELAAREIALWAKGEGVLTALGELDNYGEIGISAPARGLALMEYALSRYKIAYNVRVRGTVAETLAGELPGMIWRACASGFDSYNTSILLANPLLFSSADGKTLGARCPSSLLPEGRKGWRAALSGEDRARFEEICVLCDDLYGDKKRHGPSDVLSIWRDFLEKCRVVEAASRVAADESGLDDGVRDVSYALHELEKKIRNLDDAAKYIGPAADISLCGAEAAAFVDDWAAAATLPIQLPQRRSLTLYAGMPPTLTEHKYWFVMGADGNSWPGVMRESMLLRNEYKSKFNAAQMQDEPEREKGAPHLPEIREERERREAIFRRLAATGREGVVFCRALYDESREQVPDSQFVLSMLKERPGCGRKWRLAASARFGAQDALPDGERPRFLGAEVSGSRCERGAEFVKPAGVAAPTGEKPIVRVSDLDLWRACPYLYWCERHLRLEVPGAELYDPLAAGTLSHRVWEEAFGEKKKNPELSLRGCAAESWTRLKAESYPALDVDRRLARFEKSLMRQILDLAALQDEIEARIPRFGRLEVKSEYKLDDFEVDGVIFRAKADRVDLYENGAVVMDYKLGKSYPHMPELQVPAYGVILNAAGVDILGLGWFGQSDCTLSGYFSGEIFGAYDVQGAKRSRKCPEERMEEATASMSDMADAVKRGVYEPSYNSDSALCKNCRYFTLCRKRDLPWYLVKEEEEGSDE